jgi:hypothetical protein
MMGVIVTMIVGVAMVMIVAVFVGMAVFVRMAMAMIVVDGLHAGSHGYFRGGLRIEFLADEQHQRRPAQREQGNQPDQV